MPDVTVTRELQPGRGRYVGTVEGHTAQAELTFQRVNPGLIVADHTLTPVALRGQGIASALVEHMIADARREGFKIRPVCPFVVDAFDRRPDWADLRA